MTLKAVLFNFNGVIINDEPIRRQLMEGILIAENLRPQPEEYRHYLGMSDRSCLNALLARRGRVISESYLTKLVNQKAQAYQEHLEQLEKLPLYPGLEDLIFKLQAAQLKMAVVSGTLRSEVELVLHRANLAQYFTAIIASDDLVVNQPEPDGYKLAVERLNQLQPELDLQVSECLAIEDKPIRIQSAKQAGLSVVGVAHTLPLHMLQRQANWVIDCLSDLEVERVQQLFSRSTSVA